jgi:ADP-ribose pyrophosphatase YjhB (NUDIX family)
MTSKGILLLHYGEKDTKALLVERPYTYGFIDFIRSGLKMEDKKYVSSLITDTTQREKEKILEGPFKRLWYCVNSRGYSPNREEIFEKVKKTDWFFKLIQGKSKEPMWEIPKGRSSRDEGDLDTALRELKEETSIDSGFILTDQIINYTIFNRGVYPLVYFVGTVEEELPIDLNVIDKIEISNVAWVSLKDLNKYNGGNVVARILKKGGLL